MLWLTDKDVAEETRDDPAHRIKWDIIDNEFNGNIDDFKLALSENFAYSMSCFILSIINVILCIKNKWWREHVDTYVGLVVITSFIPPFMLYDLDYLGLMAIVYFIFSGGVSVLLHLRSS